MSDLEPERFWILRNRSLTSAFSTFEVQKTYCGAESCSPSEWSLRHNKALKIYGNHFLTRLFIGICGGSTEAHSLSFVEGPKSCMLQNSWQKLTYSVLFARLWLLWSSSSDTRSQALTLVLAEHCTCLFWNRDENPSNRYHNEL